MFNLNVLTCIPFYDSIPPELNIKDDEGKEVFCNDFRELPGAARQYKAENHCFLSWFCEQAALQ